MIENKEKQWLKEFQSFVQSNDSPSMETSRAIFSHVRLDLHPPFTHVLLKLGAIQLFAGALTLLFCPQLGVGPFLSQDGLMILFMQFGAAACAAACGAIFLGIGTCLASLFLRPEELRTLRQRQLVGIPLMSVVSLMLLMLAGASGSAILYLVWLIGAILGGEIAARVVYRVRLA